jgi:hypothetical protein
MIWGFCLFSYFSGMIWKVPGAFHLFIKVKDFDGNSPFPFTPSPLWERKKQKQPFLF